MILIVDDNSIDLKLYQAVLKPLGQAIQVTLSSEEALDLLKTSAYSLSSYMWGCCYSSVVGFTRR